MTHPRTIGPETLVRRSEEPVAVEVDRTVVMMSVEKGMYYGLEGPGPRIWSLLDQARTPRELRDTLVEEFDVDPEQCLRDVCNFLEDMLKADLVHLE